MKDVAVGIDLGCTNIKGVLIDHDGTILAESKAETREQDDQHWKRMVAEMFGELSSKAPRSITKVGLSAPGLADPDNTSISFMPGRLPGLEEFNWSAWLGHRVWVLNDAHAAMMAESSFGSAKGLRHAIILTLGTGVGGGILIDGQLYQGVGQMAGHFGHTTVDAETHTRDVTGMPGSIETAIGNTTLSERSHGLYNSTEDLVRDYNRGEPFASLVWLSSVRKLAATIASAVNVISPEAVILSGGIIQAGDSLMKPLLRFLELYEWRAGGKQTPIRFAKFSDAAGAVGAAGFAFSKMK